MNRWMEIIKKSSDYAQKSIERIASALRNSGEARLKPSYEPAYSRYRNRSRPSAPHNRGNLAPINRPNGYFFSSKLNRDTQRCRWRLQQHSGRWPRFMLRWLKKSAWNRRKLWRMPEPKLARSCHITRSLNWPAQRTLAALLSAFKPQFTDRRSSRSYGYAFLPHVKDASFSNSPFYMLKTSYLAGLRTIPTVTTLIRQNLSLLPAYKSQQDEIRRRTQQRQAAIKLYTQEQPHTGTYLAGQQQQTSEFGESASSSLLSCEDTLSSALDFDLKPRLAIPIVSELTDGSLSDITSEIESHIRMIQSVVKEFKRVAELGELPVSLEENGTVLRVHFPNSDPERLQVLVNDKDIVFGKIVEIVSPQAQSFSTSSSVLSSDDGEDSNSIWTQILEGVPELTESISSASGGSSPTLLTHN